MRRACITLWLACGLALAGCSSQRNSPYQPGAGTIRETTRAEALTRQAAELSGKQDDKAERLLREALALDLFHGPAHNNLGVIFLKRGALYEAAEEFEWAKKLMPGHPDPRVNLALTLERAGRTDDAFDTYTSALEVYAAYIPAMQGLARLQLRAGRTDDRTPGFLREIALRGDTLEWRQWAATQQALAAGR